MTGKIIAYSSSVTIVVSPDTQGAASSAIMLRNGKKVLDRAGSQITVR